LRLFRYHPEEPPPRRPLLAGEPPQLEEPPLFEEPPVAFHPDGLWLPGGMPGPGLLVVPHGCRPVEERPGPGTGMGGHTTSGIPPSSVVDLGLSQLLSTSLCAREYALLPSASALVNREMRPSRSAVLSASRR